MIHFASKAYIVIENDFNNYGVDVYVLGTFNTRVRAEKFIKKYINSNEFRAINKSKPIHWKPDINIIESEINIEQVKLPFLECVCTYHE